MVRILEFGGGDYHSPLWFLFGNRRLWVGTINMIRPMHVRADDVRYCRQPKAGKYRLGGGRGRRPRWSYPG
jgi:hypothetical protein